MRRLLISALSALALLGAGLFGWLVGQDGTLRAGHGGQAGDRTSDGGDPGEPEPVFSAPAPSEPAAPEGAEAAAEAQLESTRQERDAARSRVAALEARVAELELELRRHERP